MCVGWAGWGLGYAVGRVVFGIWIEELWVGDRDLVREWTMYDWIKRR